MNTVGKPGKLGEQIKCVVSRLDAHRGLGRQHRHPHPRRARLRHAAPLRAGRRPRPAPHELRAPTTTDMFEPEYAEVYGVPFSFIPCAGAAADPKPPRRAHPRARPRGAHRLRDHLPALLGYRYELPTERLTATFSDDSRMALSTEDIPTTTEIAPDRRRDRASTRSTTSRPSARNEVAFLLAKLTSARTTSRARRRRRQALALPAAPRHHRGAGSTSASICKDDTFPQLLLLDRARRRRRRQIYRAIVAGDRRRASVSCRSCARTTPIGSTRYVDFDTTRPVYADARRQVPRLPRGRATATLGAEDGPGLEDMPEVVRYVKNHNLGFTIPYTLNGEEQPLRPRLHRPHRRRRTATTICST